MKASNRYRCCACGLMACLAWAAPTALRAKAPPRSLVQRISGARATPNSPVVSSARTTVIEAPSTADSDPSLLDATVEQQHLVSWVIQAEVENEIKAARGRMSNDPVRVKQSLKLMLDQVHKAPELTAEMRARLTERTANDPARNRTSPGRERRAQPGRASPAGGGAGAAAAGELAGNASRKKFAN